MKRVKGFICILLSMVILLSFFTLGPVQVKAEVLVTEGYDLVAENSNYIMTFNKTTADIKVIDKLTKQEWSTSPSNWKNDKLAAGVNKESLAAHAIIETLDDSNSLVVLNTYTSSVKRKYFSFSNVDNGIKIDYDLKSQGIKLSLVFTLTEDGMEVNIPYNSVSEKGKYKITLIKLLPYFNAASKSDEGYNFVPDGSGALINYGGSFASTRDLTRAIYGSNKALGNTTSDPLEETYRLPVFGNKKNDTGFLGIVKSGDFSANITSGIAGNMTSYYRVYTSFTYREINKVKLIDSGGSATYYTKLSQKPITTDMTVKYILLKGDKANYSGMAEAYRSYLVETGVLKNKVDKDVDFNLTLIGGVKIKQTFIGIPLNLFKSLTTFKQAEEIMKELNDKGIDNINLRYLGFNSGGYMDKWTTKVTPARQLGGQKALKDLIDFTNNSKAKLFLSGELMQVHKTGSGFKTSKDAVRLLSNGIDFQRKYDLVDGLEDTTTKEWYLLTPLKLAAETLSFNASVTKNSLKNISLEDIGSIVYSDYNPKKFIYRDKVSSLTEDAVKALSKDMDNVMVTGGNQYTFKYANNIVDAPMEYSGSLQESEEIPFYEMVIHGYINYSGKAFNLTAEKTDDFLKMVEYGAVPQYNGIYKESSVIKKSSINNLISSSYKDWIEEAAKNYKSIKEAYTGIVDQMIVNHEKLSEGVYKTTYENGNAIVVNYNDEAYTIGNITIAGKNFAMIQGGE